MNLSDDEIYLLNCVLQATLTCPDCQVGSLDDCVYTEIESFLVIEKVKEEARRRELWRLDQ